MTGLPIKTPLRVSVSSWALHPLLNRAFPGRPGDPNGVMFEPSGEPKLSLLEVPAKLSALDIKTMELCHFHLPSQSASYLAEFRSALDSAGVELWSFLIDEGDLTHPTEGGVHARWIEDRLETALALGAKRSRIIAGKQSPTSENLAISRNALLRFADRVQGTGLRLLTENWFALLPNAAVLNPFLESLRGNAGLCFDFGNWSGASKYDELTKIAPAAESCHAKCPFDEAGYPNTEDFFRCLEITRAARFSGPYTLVASDANDVWGTLALQRDLLRPFLT